MPSRQQSPTTQNPAHRRRPIRRTLNELWVANPFADRSAKGFASHTALCLISF